MRAALRWFAAEFLVVLTGVLVALAMNAWWTDRTDRQRERAALRYLVADLQAAERSVAEIDRESASSDMAGVSLQRAYYLPVPPPADAVRAWLYREYCRHVPRIMPRLRPWRLDPPSSDCGV
jgi:hypothetical protein